MKIDMEIVGQRIRNARTEKRINQLDLASQLHVSAPTLSKIETANKEVSLSRLSDIAEALKVRIEYLLGIDNDIDDEHHRIRILAETFSDESCLLTTVNGFRKEPMNVKPKNAIFYMIDDSLVLTTHGILFELLIKIAQIGDKHVNHQESPKMLDQLRKDAIKEYFSEKTNNENNGRRKQYIFASKGQIKKAIEDLARSENGMEYASNYGITNIKLGKPAL